MLRLFNKYKIHSVSQLASHLLLSLHLLLLLRHAPCHSSSPSYASSSHLSQVHPSYASSSHLSQVHPHRHRRDCLSHIITFTVCLTNPNEKSSRAPICCCQSLSNHHVLSKKLRIFHTPFGLDCDRGGA